MTNTRIPGGIYDNRETMQREWWMSPLGDRSMQTTELWKAVSADLIDASQQMRFRPFPPWGSFPDLPRATA